VHLFFEGKTLASSPASLSLRSSILRLKPRPTTESLSSLRMSIFPALMMRSDSFQMTLESPAKEKETVLLALRRQ